MNSWSGLGVIGSSDLDDPFYDWAELGCSFCFPSSTLNLALIILLIIVCFVLYESSCYEWYRAPDKLRMEELYNGLIACLENCNTDLLHFKFNVFIYAKLLNNQESIEVIPLDCLEIILGNNMKTINTIIASWI